MLTNPFFVYVFTFGLVWLVYQLGWSTVYPPLSQPLLWFLFGTSWLAVLMGVASRSAVKRIRGHSAVVLPDWTVCPLAIAFAADLAANGGLPIVQNALGTFDRATFNVGIPHLHPAIVTFGCTFSVIRFADYLACRRYRYLAEATLPLVYLLLTLYRGPVLMTLVSWMFVYLILRPLTLRKGAAIGGIAIMALLAFGLLGQMREGRGGIMSRAMPSASFNSLHLPEFVLWPYVYATSPLANLDLTLQRWDSGVRESSVPIPDMLFSEFLPDVISKRLMSTARPATAEASHGLNVATMFGRAAVYAGYAGMIVMFAWFGLLCWFYIRAVGSTSLAVPGLAILNTFVVFSTFQNMIAHSGMSLQLVWVVLIHLALRGSRSSPVASRGDAPGALRPNRR